MEKLEGRQTDGEKDEFEIREICMFYIRRSKLASRAITWTTEMIEYLSPTKKAYLVWRSRNAAGDVQQIAASGCCSGYGSAHTDTHISTSTAGDF